MPGPRKGYTIPHRCAIVNSSRRNQPSDRDRQARQKLQEKTLDFYANFYNCVYLSIGPEAKRDIYNTFDPDKPFNIQLDLPSTEQPLLVEIKQEGKVQYTPLTNISPISYHNTVPSPSENNTMPTGDWAAVADPTLFDTDPLQPGKIHLHSWMLYTSQAPVLDLTGEHIKTKEDIEATFHTLNLCPQEDKEEKSNGRKKQEEPANQRKSLTDSDMSDDIES